MKKYNRKIPKIKNKALRIIGAVICTIVLISFIAGVIIGTIGGYNYDICLMKTGIRMSVISGIFMGILHILYFRTPKKFRKKLFGEQVYLRN